jgi:hypothetical protein
MDGIPQGKKGGEEGVFANNEIYDPLESLKWEAATAGREIDKLFFSLSGFVFVFPLSAAACCRRHRYPI